MYVYLTIHPSICLSNHSCISFHVVNTGSLQDKVAKFEFRSRSKTRQHLAAKSSSSSSSATTLKKPFVSPFLTSSHTSSSSHSHSSSSYLEKKVLVKLHARLIQAQTNAISAHLRWRGLVQHVVQLEVSAAAAV